MELDALTQTDAGVVVVPESAEDWAQWVAASAARNYVREDRLLDWLDLYESAARYKRDDQFPDYDERTDFTKFIFQQARRFEVAVVKYLTEKFAVLIIGGDLDIARGADHTRKLELARQTLKAMRNGLPIIHQGILRDAEHRVYGAPDLLFRSDVLRKLFPNLLSEEEARAPAPGLGASSWHYRIIDIKFTTLHLSAAGELANNGSLPAYKVQIWLYNRALGRLQEFQPPYAYLLGRSWQQGSGKSAKRGSSCLERLGVVPASGTVANGVPISSVAQDAQDWLLRVRRDGAEWQVVPQPSVPELYPNLGNQEDGPWHKAKRQIAEEIEDLTILWQVGPSKREAAHAAGVYKWRDPQCTPQILDITGMQAPTLHAILDVNRDEFGPPVRPTKIGAAKEEWRPSPRLEFYVDFETVNDLADDFSRIPDRGGQTLIFMIGCGHVEAGQWQYRCFVTKRLNPDEEARIIDEWLAHMAAVKKQLDPSGDEPRVIHWSRAEEYSLEKNYNSAIERHPEKTWCSPRWFDFWQKVMRAEPVVVRGAFGFGLKDIANALHAHGLIGTAWGEGLTDGLRAMVGAFWCELKGREKHVDLINIDLMQQIRDYNKVDCRVMMETVRYLRTHH